MIDPLMLREAYLAAAEQQQRWERLLSEHRMSFSEAERQVDRYKKIKDALKDVICRVCLGNGWTHVQYAQDDIKREKCSTCQGSGLAHVA